MSSEDQSMNGAGTFNLSSLIIESYYKEPDSAEVEE